MNFRELDFHIHIGREIKASIIREYRYRINHIIDSIFLRVPKGFGTELFSKLNVSVSNSRMKDKFWHFEGIGNVEYFDLDAEDLLSLPLEQSIRVVRSYLLRGISVAAKHDPRFATHLATIRQLIKTAHLPYDYRTGVRCSLKRAEVKAELILRIQATQYLWDVEVSGYDESERLTLKRTRPHFPYFTGFKRLKLCWNDNRILLMDQTGTVIGQRVSRLKALGQNKGHK